MSKAGRPFGTFKKVHPTRINGKITRAYGKYCNMLQRCYNQNAHNFKWYGGRGVTVCERWRGKQGYDNFVADMGLPPDGLTLERKEGHMEYGPGNCCWATWAGQALTRRKTGKINPQSLKQAALTAGLPYHCVYQRVKLLGWPLDKALATPKHPRGRVSGWRAPSQRVGVRTA